MDKARKCLYIMARFEDAMALPVVHTHVGVVRGLGGLWDCNVRMQSS